MGSGSGAGSSGQSPEAQAPPAALVGSLKPGAMAVSGGGMAWATGQKERLHKRIAEARRYPTQAARLGVEGSVELRFRLDAAGQPQQVEVVNADSTPDFLATAAVETLTEGAPYESPGQTRRVEFTVGVAWRWSGEPIEFHSTVVASSGADSVDAKAIELAREDAGGVMDTEWHVTQFTVVAKIAFMATNGAFDKLEIIEFEGDERWKRFLEVSWKSFIQAPEVTDFIRIPIVFELE